MKNRIMTLLTFLAVFAFSAPALASAPEGKTATEAKADAKADTKADAKEDAKAEGKEDAKADAKTEGKEDAKADAKAEGTSTGGEDTAGTGGTDEKAAPSEVTNNDEAKGAAKALLTAVQEKHWALALGLALSLLVFGMRKMNLLNMVPAKALPWVTALFGVVGYVVATLMADGADMSDAIIGGASTGIAAVGLWEMVLKRFLGKQEDDSEEDDAEEDDSEEEESEEDKSEEEEADKSDA